LDQITALETDLIAYIAEAEEKLRDVQTEKQYKTEGTEKSPSQETA
jgi:hypothetical protein